jgi:hypothetical protein
MVFYTVPGAEKKELKKSYIFHSYFIVAEAIITSAHFVLLYAKQKSQ